MVALGLSSTARRTTRVGEHADVRPCAHFAEKVLIMGPEHQ